MSMEHSLEQVQLADPRQRLGKHESPWESIIGGLILAAVALGLYLYPHVIVAGSGRAALVRALLLKLYEFGGQWGPGTLFAVLALVSMGNGVYELRQRRRRQGSRLSVQALNGYLAEGLEFAEQDLHANRQGQLTEPQLQRMQELRAKARFGTCLTAMMILLALGYVAYMLATSQMLRQSMVSDPQVLLVSGLAVGVVVLLIAGSYIRSLVRWRGLSKPKVSLAEGRVRLKSSRMPWHLAAASKAFGGSSRACSIKLGGQRFRVQQRVLNSFLDGGHYRIYFVKYSPAHIILSAEALSDG